MIRVAAACVLMGLLGCEPPPLDAECHQPVQDFCNRCGDPESCMIQAKFFGICDADIVNAEAFKQCEQDSKHTICAEGTEIPDACYEAIGW